MKRWLYIALLFAVFVPYGTMAQATYTLHADTNKILIGQQVQLSLRASFPEGTPIHWPMLADTVGPAEIISRSGIDTAKKGEEVLLEERITVTLWDSGYYIVQVPPLLVDTDSLRADPIFMTVNTVEELGENPFDIKAPEDAPKTLADWLRQLWPFLLAAVLIAVGVWWWMNKRPHRAVAEAKAPPIDPYEQALNELGQLRENKLWQKGEVKEYYDGLTDIARRFLELERGLPALERTTDETRDLLAGQPVASEVKDDFIRLMQEADMVKFAKERFDDEACERALRRARSFIEAVHQSTLNEQKSEAS